MIVLEILIHFALGFATSFIGSIPFGSINLAVVRISITEIGPQLFAYSWSYFSRIVLQLYLYSFFCILLTIPKLEFYIKITTIPIFILLGGLYFFSRSKKQYSDSTPVYKNNFFQGLTIGFFKPLANPFLAGLWCLLS